jgi:predicted DsbA family dithiol-disulfide isomerase
MVEVAPGSIVIWSDIGCAWAHVAVHRLHAARSRLDLDNSVRFAHRPFPLELFNQRPTPRDRVRAEVAVLAEQEPDAGWQEWDAPEWHWPVTMLPALEAVQGAAAQDLRAAEQLDRALRVAFFAESRCISMRHVILEVAEKCETVDVESLAGALDDGVARRALIARYEDAVGSDEIKGSPHVFLSDGTNVLNPGIEMHWNERGDDLVVDADDPGVYEDLLTRAAA